MIIELVNFLDWFDISAVEGIMDDCKIHYEEPWLFQFKTFMTQYEWFWGIPFFVVISNLENE